MRPKFLNSLAEGLSSTWRLLSDTTNFLSRAKLLPQYEGDLTEWRSQLHSFRKNPEVARQVRDRIVALRRQLRTQGYDLRLGSKDIVLEGFRHDDAMADGFQRLVLGIGEDDVIALAGEYNHIELARFLERRLAAQRRRPVYSMHYLWYRWRNQVLVLSGADSETAQQFEELKRYFAEKKELLLKKLSRL